MQFGELMRKLERPVLAFCRTGMRAATLWGLCEASSKPLPEILDAAKTPGTTWERSLTALPMAASSRSRSRRQATKSSSSAPAPPALPWPRVSSRGRRTRHRDHRSGRHPLLPARLDDGRRRHLRPAKTARTMASVLPRGVHWIKSGVAAFEPEITLSSSTAAVPSVTKTLVCPGLKLDWGAIAGLAESLGRNGVTSNYRYDLAPYTWELVRRLKRGRAIFTQPPMPIKCAGAPQKAMYLSA